MLPFGVTIPATVPQRSEFPEGLMNYPVHNGCQVGISPGVNRQGQKVTTLALLVLKLRISGAVPPPPLNLHGVYRYNCMSSW